MAKPFVMTDKLCVYSAADLQSRVRRRAGETKLGERMRALPGNQSWIDELAVSPAKFVLLGLPEDIGIRANYGRGGAWSAWEPALVALLNMQSNALLDGEELLLLGHVDFSDLMHESDSLDLKTREGMEAIRALTAQVDERVWPVIHAIAKAGKIPIVIGGGHNNAFPILRGMAEGRVAGNSAQEKSLNVLNLDAHSDLRAMEGRHSGNGFRYAWESGYIDRYCIAGLQQQYISAAGLDFLRENEQRIKALSFEELFIYNSSADAIRNSVETARDFFDTTATGIEIDLDLVQNTPSSAKTPSGISPNQARQFAYLAAKELNAAYLHLAEAAPVLSHIKADNKTGKLLAFLVTDFVKGKKNR